MLYVCSFPEDSEDMWAGVCSTAGGHCRTGMPPWNSLPLHTSQHARH